MLARIGDGRVQYDEGGIVATSHEVAKSLQPLGDIRIRRNAAGDPVEMHHLETDTLSDNLGTRDIGCASIPFDLIDAVGRLPPTPI